MDELTEIHILSLGAGVQSTAVYLLAMEGKVRIDCAVFADTGDEPAAVYRHLEWLKSLNGPPIHVISRGRISDDLLSLDKGQRFASVPFYTKAPDGSPGMGRRQCSKEYKVEIISRYIRRDILGLKPRCRIPKTTIVHQYFGISADEARRSVGIKNRTANPHFPLMELGWTRGECQRYLEGRVPHETPRSACVYCPFHSDAEWMAIKAVPEDWALALKVDRGLRSGSPVVSIRKLRGHQFVHRSMVPLEEVEFKHERQFNMFTLECEGMCGN